MQLDSNLFNSISPIRRADSCKSLPACSLAVLSLSLLLPVTVTGQAGEIATAKPKLGAEELTASDLAVVVIDPRRLMSWKGMQGPGAQQSLKSVEQMGINPKWLTRITLSISGSGPRFTFRLTDDADLTAVRKAFIRGRGVNSRTVVGRKFDVVKFSSEAVLVEKNLCIYAVNEDAMPSALVTSRPGSRLTDLIAKTKLDKAIVAVIDVQGSRIHMPKPNLAAAPPQLQGLAELPTLTSAATITISPTDTNLIGVMLTGNSPADAKTIAAELTKSWSFVKGQFPAMVMSILPREPAVKKMLANVSSQLAIQQQGATVNITLPQQADLPVMVEAAIRSFTNYGKAVTEEARRKQTLTQLNLLKQTIALYYLDTAAYPKTLDAFIKEPAELKGTRKWRGPYLNVKKIPVDPWGEPYQYRLKPNKSGRPSITISSTGPDKKAGTADDLIVNTGG